MPVPSTGFAYSRHDPRTHPDSRYLARTMSDTHLPIMHVPVSTHEPTQYTTLQNTSLIHPRQCQAYPIGRQTSAVTMAATLALPSSASWWCVGFSGGRSVLSSAAMAVAKVAPRMMITQCVVERVRPMRFGTLESRRREQFLASCRSECDENGENVRNHLIV